MSEADLDREASRLMDMCRDCGQAHSTQGECYQSSHTGVQMRDDDPVHPYGGWDPDHCEWCWLATK